jgi:hypothetical protein
MRGPGPEINPRSWGPGRTTIMDPGPWGQSKLITWAETLHPSPVSIIRGNLEMTEETGELLVRSYSLGLERLTQQPDGVTGAGNTQLANVAVVARVKYGVGGASLEAEVNVKRGTMLTFPATMWDIGAYIEQIPDMSAPPGTLFPDAATGPKTVMLHCVAGLGTHPGGSTLPTRDQYYRFDPANPAPIVLPIPAAAARVTITGDVNFDPTLLQAQFVGAQDVRVVNIPQATLTAFGFALVPGQATDLDLSYGGPDDTLITITYEIAL